MGRFLGLPEVLETDDEDENHVGLAGLKKVLWFSRNLVLPRNGYITAKRKAAAFWRNSILR